MAPRFRVLLAGLLATALAVGTDFVSLGVLLPSIEDSFDTDIHVSQWVVNVYALAFAMAIIPGGRLADLFGRRRALLAGIALFVLGSLADMVAPSIGALIAARAVQGVGAAVMWPTAMSVMFSSAPEGRAGGFIGLLMSVAGIGNVVGPLIAGAAADVGADGWRLFFGANVVIALVAFGLLAYAAPKPAPDELGHDRVDLLGVALLAVALCGLLLAFDDAGVEGWLTPTVVVPFVAFVVFLALFVVVERRVEVPLVPRYFWSNRQLMAASVANGAIIGANFITFVFVPQIGQEVWDDSPFVSALRLVPNLVVFASLSPFAGRAYDRFGGRWVVGTGTAVAVLGILWIAIVPADSYWTWLLPGLLVVGAGLALVIGPLSTIAVDAVRPEDGSLASAMAFQFHLIGGAVSVTIATLIITSASGLVDGYQLAYWYGAALAAVGLFLVPWLPSRARSPEPASA